MRPLDNARSTSSTARTIDDSRCAGDESRGLAKRFLIARSTSHGWGRRRTLASRNASVLFGSAAPKFGWPNSTAIDAERKVSYASIRELLRVTIVALAAMVAGCADSRGT